MTGGAATTRGIVGLIVTRGLVPRVILFMWSCQLHMRCHRPT